MIQIILQEKFSIHFHGDDLLVSLKHLPFEGEKARFFSLSDILSFADKEYLKAVFLLIKGLKRGYNTLIFRTFVRNRLTTDDLKPLQDEFGLITDLSKNERTHFYQVFQIDL